MFIVPMNNETETLFYNHRMIIDNDLYNPDAEPRAWLISKINRLNYRGNCVVTLKQDRFDQHKDYIERNEDGYIIGKWADYYLSDITPTPIIPDENEDEDEPVVIDEDITCVISYSGVKPQLKVGGSYKTFTMNFFDDENEPIEHSCDWNYKLDGEVLDDTSELLQILTGEPLEYNQVKIKFLGDDNYYGSILTIFNDYTSLDIEIVGM